MITYQKVYFNFKGKFLGHIKTLKKKGSNITVMYCIDNWIDDNIDEIYETFQMSELVRSIKKNPRIEDPEEQKVFQQMQLKALLLSEAENVLIRKNNSHRNRSIENIKSLFNNNGDFVRKQDQLDS